MLRSLFGRQPLGELSSEPSSGLLKQIQDVKNRMQLTTQRAAEYNKKLADLSTLSEALTRGYVSNLNILVDVAAVLNEYKLLMTTVIDQLQHFDTSVGENFKNINVEHIRDLTSQKLDKVAQFFASDGFQKLKNTLESNGKSDAASMLSESASNFRSMQDRASSTYASLTTGGRRKRRSKKK